MYLPEVSRTYTTQCSIGFGVFAAGCKLQAVCCTEHPTSSIGVDGLVGDRGPPSPTDG